MTLSALVSSERVNAIIGWIMIAIVVLGTVENLLTSSLLWGWVLASSHRRCLVTGADNPQLEDNGPVAAAVQRRSRRSR